MLIKAIGISHGGSVSESCSNKPPHTQSTAPSGMQQEIPDQELQQVSDHNMQDDGDVNYYQEGGEYENTEELSLDMLKDSPPGQKPMYPFSTLIRFVLISLDRSMY